MKGVVLNIDLKSDSGLIRSDDCFKYDFDLSACQNGLPLEGSVVDFEIRDGKADQIYILKTTLNAKLDWLFWFLFSFRGRISRDQFLLFWALSFFLLPVPVLFAALSGYAFAFIEIEALVFLYFVATITVKRFHDSGTSAAWLVFTLLFDVFVGMLVSQVLILAFVGQTAMYALTVLSALLIIFCICLCFAKGTIGENRYGKEPYRSKTVRLK